MDQLGERARFCGGAAPGLRLRHLDRRAIDNLQQMAHVRPVAAHHKAGLFAALQ